MIELNTNTYPLKLPTTLSVNTVESLEKSLAAYFGYHEVIVLNTVDNAFSLALSTLGKKSGVLCSPNAPIALYRALQQHNLQAEYCDLRLDGTMETRFFSKTKTAQSSALILSHNHGLLSDSQKTRQFTQESGLTFIEDATQAFGKREKSGASLVIYSLDTLVPSSIATGAFIATDDIALGAALRKKSLGGYEQKKLWNYDVINTDEDLRIAPLTAQLALAALREIGEREEAMKMVQEIYLDRLSANRLIELPDASALIAAPLFPIGLVPALFCPKEDIYQALVEAGIPVKVGNKPIYKTTTFKDETLSLFGAEEVFKAQLLLPSHHLMTADDINFVVETFTNVLETYGYRGCAF